MSRISTLTRARDLAHLEAQLQNILHEVREEFRRQQTNAAQQGERISAARPIEQNDVVRLVDLTEAVAGFEKRNFNVTGAGGSGNSVNPPFSLVGVFYGQVGFLEAPDDVRLLFTPEVVPSTDSNGYLMASLFHRGAYVHQTLGGSPPPIGLWRWTGTQVEFPAPDVPLHTHALHFASVVVLP